MASNAATHGSANGYLPPRPDSQLPQTHTTTPLQSYLQGHTFHNPSGPSMGNPVGLQDRAYSTAAAVANVDRLFPAGTPGVVAAISNGVPVSLPSNLRGVGSQFPSRP